MPAPAEGLGGWRAKSDDDDDDDRRRHWRDKAYWRQRMGPAMGDLRDLRGIAYDMAGKYKDKYRKKKWKKKDDDDD